MVPARRSHAGEGCSEPRTLGGRAMAGMLQIITYLLALYLVIKGVEVLQLALTSNRDKRRGVIALGAVTLAACVLGAIVFTVMQDQQAQSLGRSMPSFPR